MDDGTTQLHHGEQSWRLHLRLIRAVAIGVLGAVGLLTLVTSLAGASTPSSGLRTASTTTPGSAAGYDVAGADGGVFSFGGSPFHGSMGGQHLNAPIVGVASTPRSGGYWEDASDGGIFGFGNATFFGSMGGQPLNAPIVGIASTRDGGGYWEVASDGGIFSFGNATFFGSMGGKPLNAPIVGIASTSDGGGYWEVASDGGIFSFGDATFFGSMGGHPLNAPIVGVASTRSGGGGYWEAASDGGIFAFGGAVFDGSMGGQSLNQPIVGIATVPGGAGYWEVATDGGIFAFGDASSSGSLPGLGVHTGNVVGITGSAAAPLAPFPTLSSFSPEAGPTSGGNTVTLTGTNLVAPATVSFGTNPATSVVATSQSLTATVPAGTGTVDVTVTTLGGTFTILQGYTYESGPTVSAISPNAGPTAGGTSITITGTNFTPDSTVTIGGSPVSLAANSATSLTFVAPPASSGAVHVVVTTPGGTSSTSSADQYTYEGVPSVTGLSPNAGPTAGATSVTVTGTNFTSDSTVSFGGTSASGVTRNSSTSLTATSPAGSLGTVDVTVTTAAGGISATSPADQYTYVDAPTVTSISSPTGPTAGGTSVTIIGTHFTSASDVSFGATSASSFVVNTGTSITATSPAGSAGTVDVTVTNPGGTSPTSSADQFTYEAVPTVTSISPNTAPAGTTVIITGSNFTPNAQVMFGGTVALGAGISPTSFTAISPAASAGTVDVTITTPGGTSATSSADEFTTDSALGLTATPSTSTEVGVAYSQTNTPSGGSAPYAYFVSSGAVPQGTTLSTTTGTVSGTPTVAGPFSYTVQVTDFDDSTATQTSSGTIASLLSLVATPSTDAEVGEAYTQTNVASGGTGPYTYASVAGTTPLGTFVNPATGTFVGSPIASGPFSYTIQVTDSDGATATQATSGTIAATLTLVATPSADTEAGVAYSQTNVASGGIAPYAYSVSAGTVPQGTTLNSSTGTVSGTPTASGPFSYTIQVTDSDGATATQTTSGVA